MTIDSKRADVLQEVHHRAFNNLQIVASLLMLHEQEATCDCCGETLRKARLRVDTMARVHRGLTHGDSSLYVPVAQLFRALLNETTQGRVPTIDSIEWSVAPEDSSIRTDDCVGLAILMMEIVDIFDQRLAKQRSLEKPHLHVRYGQSDKGHRELVVEAMSAGPIATRQERDSVHDMLVNALCEQLRGSVEWSADGCFARVTFGQLASVGKPLQK